MSMQGLAVLNSSAKIESVREAYDAYSSNYDSLDDGILASCFGFPKLRSEMIQKASGNVLEVAVGTGLNLAHYKQENVETLMAVDISQGMLDQAAHRDIPPLLKKKLTFLQADVDNLPFPPGSFDTVIDTFSLCVFPQPEKALAAMASALAPGGRLLILEHSRSPNVFLGSYQDITAETVKVGGKGCVWNQDVPKIVQRAGLRIHEVHEHLGGLIVQIEATK